MIELSDVTAASTAFLIILLFLLGWPKRRYSFIRLNGKIDALLKHAGVEYKPYENLSPAVAQEIQRGNKLKAIKLYRDETGVGLKEAKEYIEGDFDSLSRLDGKLDALLKHSGVEYKPHENLSAAVSQELQRGNKIGAIKLYREETGVGLKEAKDFIEEVQESRPGA